MISDYRFHHRRIWSRWVAIFTVVSIIAALIPISTVSAADTSDGISTGYTVQIDETVSDNGFTHPGVGLTKELLERTRAQVLAKKEPWYSNYLAMASSDAASKTVTSSNTAGGAFNSQGFNGRFIADGLKAYTQALMYFITGDEVYRSNAMRIIRIWEQMDPAKYEYFTDAHIHTGVPLNRMVTAAEILRYTSYQDAANAWTDQDTANFTNNLIIPVTETFLHTNYRFMNQHTYPLLGAMAGYIFTNNRERYNEAVEWFTVNKTALDQGFNGSISRLFRMVNRNDLTGEPAEPRVQLVEMGRDQAHAGGDLTNAGALSRLMMGQGTKVDPVEGTPSDNADAVGPYDFLDDRILAAADYYWRYMLGYDTPWTPVAYAISPDGTIRDTYNHISDAYRGRFANNKIWDLFYYYKYVKGVNIEEKAPYFYEAFLKRRSPDAANWNDVDGGSDEWLYMPLAAETDAAAYAPKEYVNGSKLEIENRATLLSDKTTIMQEGDTSFIRFNATPEGSKVAVTHLSMSENLIGFYIRTNGVASLNAGSYTLTLPDTNGQWRYITCGPVSFGTFFYMTVKGSAGTTVDVEHVLRAADQNLTPPVFTSGNSDMTIYTYAGSPLQLDFSATATGSTGLISYELQNAPAGALINRDTGAFSWQPTQTGDVSFIVVASDGTTVATRNVTIHVAADRASAVQAVTAPYDPNAIYTTESLAVYQGEYEKTLGAIDGTSDEAFMQQLIALRSIVEALDLVTPLNPDGSIHYDNIVYWSSWGNAISNMDDMSNQTGGWYGLALGSPPDNLHHIIDFGPDYKVSATKFGFQSNIFADRLANSAVYGSNDMVHWIRLTPGVTTMTQEYQTLNVDPAYQNMKFRYFKLRMLQPLPDVLYGIVRNLLELQEFRIYGERYGINNKIASVSLSSDQSLNGRIVIGDTVKLSIQGKEPIQNVKVKIQGLDAAVSTTDQIHWTAVAAMKPGVAPGPVTFSIDYQRNDGTDGDPTYATTDGSKLFVADESDLINVMSITNVTDSYGRSPTNAIAVANALFDGNPGTGTDYRLNGSGAGGWVKFDFREGGYALLTSVEILAVQSGYYTRINGTVVQGSNDNTTWTTISSSASSTRDWQLLTINSQEKYRYIRIYNANNWFGNMAEVRFHGDLDYDAAYFDSIVLAPDGYTQGSYYLYQQKVKQLREKLAQPGASKMAILEELLQAKEMLVPITAIYPKIAVTPSMVTANTISWDGKYSAAVNGWRAFDGDPSTSPDTKTASGYVTVNLGEGSAKTVNGIRFISRPGNPSRMNGALIQGSNDGINYLSFYTIDGVSSDQQWYSREINNNTAYRYLRYYTPNGYANVGELEFYEKVNDKTLLTVLLQEAAAVNVDHYTAESVAALQSEVSAAQAVNNNAGASQGEIDAAAQKLREALEGLEIKITASLDPSAPNGLNDWYTAPVTVTLSAYGNVQYSLDGGSSWSVYDAPVALSQEGPNQMLYQPVTVTDSVYPKSVNVKIDLTAPQVTIAGEASYTIDQTVGITCSAVDTVSGVTYSRCDAPLVNVKAYTLDPGLHKVTAEAEDGAGHRGSAEHSYSVVATFDSLSALTGTFAVETGAAGADQVAAGLQQQLETAEARAAERKGAEARKLLQAYMTEVNKQSGNVFTAGQAAVLVRWAQWLYDVTPLASGAPGKPVLSGNNGHDTGLKDGSYTVTMNLWWGNNGTEFKLFENGKLISAQKLTDNSPEAQTVKTDITGKANGTYTYTCELTNVFGTTACDPLIVKVTDASPGKPVLSHNNWDGDGTYDVTMNMWWGTNGSEYRLYENGVLIDTKTLNVATPKAQKAVTNISGRAPGVYEYRAVLVNAAGETSSETISITVKQQ